MSQYITTVLLVSCCKYSQTLNYSKCTVAVKHAKCTLFSLKCWPYVKVHFIATIYRIFENVTASLRVNHAEPLWSKWDFSDQLEKPNYIYGTLTSYH